MRGSDLRTGERRRRNLILQGLDRIKQVDMLSLPNYRNKLLDMNGKAEEKPFGGSDSGRKSHSPMETWVQVLQQTFHREKIVLGLGCASSHATDLSFPIRRGTHNCPRRGA